jgi:hypothetical protein
MGLHSAIPPRPRQPILRFINVPDPPAPEDIPDEDDNILRCPCGNNSWSGYMYGSASQRVSNHDGNVEYGIEETNYDASYLEEWFCDECGSSPNPDTLDELNENL